MKTRLLFPSLFLSNFTVRPALNTRSHYCYYYPCKNKRARRVKWAERHSRARTRSIIIFHSTWKPRDNLRERAAII